MANENSVVETTGAVAGTDVGVKHMTEPRRMTADELKANGIQLTRNRKEVNYSKDDGSKNAKIKLGQYRAEAIAAYKKIMRLADGNFSYNGDSYPVTVSATQRDWVLNALADMHDATLQALESGTRPTVVIESCPD